MIRCIPKRYMIMILSHLGFIVVYALRVNLSVAIVSMVNSTDTGKNHNTECTNGKNITIQLNRGEFNWNEKQENLVLGAFFYGYILTQIIGGWFASKYGGKWIFGLGVAITSALTILTPIAARKSFYSLIFLRVAEGLFEGVTFPCMNYVISQWAPPLERSQMLAISYSGQYSGTIIGLPLTGLLADSSWGWPSVFYVFGASGIVWFIFWAIFGANSPQEDKMISKEEKDYILESLKNYRANPPKSTPWLSFFKSIHVWAIIVGHFSNNWVFYMILTGLPLYFKQVLGFELKENAFLSALPFIVGFIVCFSSGFIADTLRKRFMTTKQARRVMAILGFYPAAVFLMLANYMGCDKVAYSVTFMVLALGFLCLNTASYQSNHMDIGPRFTSTLFGITNSFATIPGFVEPLVSGYFTNLHPTREQYNKVFWIAAAVCVAGGSFFIAFVEGKVQPWNDLDRYEDIDKRSLINNADIEENN